MQKNDIHCLFNPRSVVIVGATSNSTKIGFRIIDNIKKHPFKGKLYLVNPKGGHILDMLVLKSIDDLPMGVDLAILAIPKSAIFSAIKSCIKRKIKFVIALTAGFKEIGSEGVKLENDLKELISQSSIRLIGPNCAGICNTWANLQATFEIYPEKGNVSFISQSGSICSAFSSNISVRKTGISKYISLGNKMNVNEVDLVDYLGNDPTTKCISLYLEDITDGRTFLKVAYRVSFIKPIIILKSGRTIEGSRATFSHTGALSGEDQLVDGAFHQVGIIRVNNLTELYDISAAIQILGPLKGNKIAIISDAGGPGVIATDVVSYLGLKLPNPSEKTQKKLRSFLPNFASVQNPIDMTFTREEDLYYRCIKALKDEIDAVLITIPSHLDTKDELVSILADARRETQIPIVVAWLCADEVEQQRRDLWDAGIPTFLDPQQASLCLNYLAWYGQWLNERMNTPIYNKFI